MDDAELRTLTFSLLAPKLEAAGISAVEVEESTSLVDLGILDSMGFLELISQLEIQSGRTIDFDDVDPEEFTTVAGILRLMK